MIMVAQTEPQLSPWQVTVSDELQKLHQRAYETRQPLVKFIQELPKPSGAKALDEVAFVLQVVEGLSSDNGMARAKEILRPRAGMLNGLLVTAIHQWRFDDESLWRGLSDNTKLALLARSMVSSGFLEDEPIRARSFDLSGPDSEPVTGRLLLGDGQARGLAARLAWQLIINKLSTDDTMRGDPALKKILKSLLQIPTVFEQHGTGSPEDIMVAQAARQNVKATMSLPLNTLEWAVLVLKCSGHVLGSSLERKNILECLGRCTGKYDDQVDVKAYDMEPLAKRQRKGRRRSAGGAAQDEGQPEDADRLKIGRRRQVAIRNILSFGTPASNRAHAVSLSMGW